MRASVYIAVGLGLVSLTGCVWSARNEGFTATGPDSFLYSARTNTVMTENDDGAAERLRRRWIADAVGAHGMCGNGYVVDTRSFMPNADGRFANGGAILYQGRCLSDVMPPPLPIPNETEQKQEQKVSEAAPNS